jgi:hypothetical protein
MAVSECSYCRTEIFTTDVCREPILRRNFGPSGKPEFTYFCPAVSVAPQNVDWLGYRCVDDRLADTDTLQSISDNRQAIWYPRWR